MWALSVFLLETRQAGCSKPIRKRRVSVSCQAALPKQGESRVLLEESLWSHELEKQRITPKGPSFLCCTTLPYRITLPSRAVSLGLRSPAERV